MFSKKRPRNDYPYYRQVWVRAVLILLAASLIPLMVIGGGVFTYTFEKLESHTLDMLHEQVYKNQPAVDAFLAKRESQLNRIRLAVIITFFGGGVLIAVAILMTTGRLVGLLETKGQILRVLDRQLRRTSYLSSSMELAMGFFEEIKDILSNIDVSVQWLVDNDPAQRAPDVKETLVQIAREASRGHLLMDKFAAFVRPEDPIVAGVRINDLLDDLLAFLNKELEKRSILVIRDYQTPLPFIRSDRGKLRQVFQNLMLNAISALGKGGEIRLVTRSEGNEISIVVSDNGHGIPAADLPRIFDPLFTTKPQGTGLGLPICKTILDQLGGTLSVDSRPGQGAAFTVKLPGRIIVGSNPLDFCDTINQ